MDCGKRHTKAGVLHLDRRGRLVLLCALLTALAGCSVIGSVASSPAVRAASDMPNASGARLFLVSRSADGHNACEDAELRLNYLNVGQAGAVFIEGPTRTLMFDFGETIADGNRIAKWLTKQGYSGREPFDYGVLSHRHIDHFSGFKRLSEHGFRFRTLYDGSSLPPPESTRIWDDWWAIAKEKHGQYPAAIPVGDTLDLGCGAEVFVAYANGVLFDREEPIDFDDVNDGSVSLLITHGDFSATLDGDLGSGIDPCTKPESHGQAPIQPLVMQALIDSGRVNASFGVDLLYIAHHGSHTSSGPAYFNLARPEVAIANVGHDPKNKRYFHPRAIVIDSVLLGPNRPDCVTAPPVLACYQTEDGYVDKPVDGTLPTVSNACIAGGDITVTVDAAGDYTVSGNNDVAEDTAAEFGETVAFSADEHLSGTLRFMKLASGRGLEFRPFFDAADNPVPVSDSPVAAADLTPIQPALSHFEGALLDLCGPFGSELPSAKTQLAGLFERHVDVRDTLASRLTDAGVPMSTGTDFSRDIAALWSQENAFAHVFCGDNFMTDAIGGLHYAGRLARLQTAGLGGRGNGPSQADGRGTLTIPIIIACPTGRCTAARKSYRADWSAPDIFWQATVAWFRRSRDGAGIACVYTLPDDAGKAVLVTRDGALRSFYPVVTAKQSIPPCTSAEFDGC